MKIVPNSKIQSHRTGLLSNVTAADINAVLGFRSNVNDDKSKVVNSWGFTADGVPCAIWDYKGSHLSGRYSTFGPVEVFKKLFPGKVI